MGSFINGAGIALVALVAFFYWRCSVAQTQLDLFMLVFMSFMLGIDITIIVYEQIVRRY